MKVELHQLNERLRAYVESSVLLSVELIPRFFMPLFFAKLFFCSRPQRSWSFQTRYDRHGWPVIENTCHFEITKMDRLKFEKSSLAAPTRKIWIIEISLALWSCQNKKKQKNPPGLSLISSRILIGFCWKEGLVFVCIRAGCPPSNRQIKRSSFNLWRATCSNDDLTRKWIIVML